MKAIKKFTKDSKIGILTSGFHLKRAKILAREFLHEFFNQSLFFAAYSPKMALNTWYKYEDSKKIILNEIRKTLSEDYRLHRFFNS